MPALQIQNGKLLMSGGGKLWYADHCCCDAEEPGCCCDFDENSTVVYSQYSIFPDDPSESQPEANDARWGMVSGFGPYTMEWISCDDEGVDEYVHSFTDGDELDAYYDCTTGVWTIERSGYGTEEEFEMGCTGTNNRIFCAEPDGDDCDLWVMNRVVVTQ